MAHYLSFSVSNDELERSTPSSERSFEYADSVEDTFNDVSQSKRCRKGSDCGQRPRQRRKLNDLNSQMACPFAKHDPLRHRQCFKYNKLDQISRLKQHLLRVHQVPIHCVRCSQTFSTEDKRDAHLRSLTGCTVQPNHIHLGITETQKVQLAQRVSAKRSKEDNWYLIYEILFPGSPKPDTPYLDGTQFSEELFTVREFAVREAPRRIAKLASARRQDARYPYLPPEYKLQTEAFAFAAVKDVLDAVVDQWLCGGVLTGDSERTNPTTPVHLLDPTSPSPSSFATSKSIFEARHISSEEDASAVQIPSEAAAFDHVLPSIVEGTKPCSAADEPSRLDWLSMVADMDSKSWDEYLNTCLDGALQQPLK